MRPETALKVSDFFLTNPIGRMVADDIRAGEFEAARMKIEAALSAMISALKGGLMSGETSICAANHELQLVLTLKTHSGSLAADK